MKKLMLRRIDWNEKNEDAEVDDDAPINKCVMVWEGVIARPNFSRFTVEEITDNDVARARQVFETAKVSHYWDLARSVSVDEGMMLNQKKDL
jgi:U4/U6 small nuclear ribonucleoprotein PRP3